MAPNWRDIVTANAPAIVSAAHASGERESVCLLLDMDAARSGAESPGINQLVVETQLRGAIPLRDPSQVYRIVCLPVSRERLLSILASHEDTSVLESKLRTGGTLILWAVCVSGDARQLIDIHIATPEIN
jgi:hypothetical protein